MSNWNEGGFSVWRHKVSFKIFTVIGAQQTIVHEVLLKQYSMLEVTCSFGSSKYKNFALNECQYQSMFLHCVDLCKMLGRNPDFKQLKNQWIETLSCHLMARLTYFEEYQFTKVTNSIHCKKTTLDA